MLPDPPSPQTPGQFCVNPSKSIKARAEVQSCHRLHANSVGMKTILRGREQTTREVNEQAVKKCFQSKESKSCRTSGWTGTERKDAVAESCW